jgi:hypothetical protein
MATNNDSPVLDGIYFRPVLVKPAAVNAGASNDATQVGNSIPPKAKSVVVRAVTNDANDWITLPSLADVANGHEINILASAGGNFEMRTPTTGEKINNINTGDNATEYLCTDTDVIRVFKVSNTQGWVAQSLTNLGAVRTAVVPD